MNLNRMMMFIMAALLTVSFTACGSENVKVSESTAEPKKNLKVYYMNYDWKIQKALLQFSEKYKDVNVEDTIFHNEEDYKSRLFTDILSGKGPDVVIIKHGWVDAGYKFWSGGVLSDLNEFIKKDKEFNLSDYNEKVLNSFEQEEKRLMIPLDFNFDTFVTSKQALQRNNIKIDPSNWNYNELLKVVKKFQDENKGKKKYFFNKDFSISSMIKSSGISFVDYINKKSLFGSKDFIEILEIYKELYPSVCPYREGKDIPYTNCIKDDTFIMQLLPYINPSSITGQYALYKSFGDDMEFYTLPPLKGESSSIASYAAEAAGINSQSKNKDAAYQFIKVLMSKEFQTTHQGNNVVFGIPILKAAYTEDLHHYMSKKYEDDGSFYEDEHEIKRVPLPERIKLQLDSMISKVDKCEMEDREILNIVNEALPDFLNAKKTASETAKEIDTKVNLYLNQ